jgi:hypothetical protein
VFVNRGWVPKAAAQWTRPDGVLTLEAVVAEPEKVKRRGLYNHIYLHLCMYKTRFLYCGCDIPMTPYYIYIYIYIYIDQAGSFAPQNYPSQRHLLWTKRSDLLEAVGMTEEQIEFEIFEGACVRASLQSA